MVVGNVHAARICGICAHPEHPTNMCPTLQEDKYHQFNAIGGYSGQQQRRFDSYFDTYNS